MKFKLSYSTKFKKSFKKLTSVQQEKVLAVLGRLANGETLEAKFKNHKLSGHLSAFSDCHVEPDLVLVYQKRTKFWSFMRLW